MLDTSRLIYLHGLESDSNSGKTWQFREWFSGILTPDFRGTFDERMVQLDLIISDKANKTLIGSSLDDLCGLSTPASSRLNYGH